MGDERGAALGERGDALLILNAGSSTLKFSVFAVRPDGQLDARLGGTVDRIGDAPRLVLRRPGGGPEAERRLSADEAGNHGEALALVERSLEQEEGGVRLVGVGHRVVHGGTRYDRPVRIDAKVLAELERLVPLAPLHQPHHVAAIRAVAEAHPELPQVACFDTAFHRRQPELAQAFGLPAEIAGEGVRRYGFHGLSYEYVSLRLRDMAPDLARGRVVIAHLGNGASMCAVEDGRSIATTMGLTALDGLVMGTRCGAIDPGVLLYLMSEHHMDADALTDLLYERSGLLGVSGISADMRELLASDAPSARRAVDLFVYRAGRELGSLAAALGGLDGLVFTGGIGENAASIRARIGRDARWLGLALDEAANEAGGPRISRDASRVQTWVVPTDENRMIARHTRQLLATGS
jgi:acetate kinase